MKQFFTLIFALLGIVVQAQNFTPGNIVVTRIGDGTNTLGTATTNVSLLEFNTTTANQASAVKTVNLGVGSTAGSRLTLSGTTQAEGQLSLSQDGRFLTVFGYDQDINSAQATHRAGNKIVARIDNTGAINYYATNAPIANGATRSVVSNDGSSFWVSLSGTGSVNYFTAAAPTTLTATGFNSDASGTRRNIAIFKGQLYEIDNTTNIKTSNPALPTLTGATTGSTVFNVASNNPVGFAFLDLDATADWNGTGYDVLYIPSGNGSLSKFFWNGSAWVLASNYSNASQWGTVFTRLSNIVAFRNSAGKAVIYVTTGDGGANAGGAGINHNNNLLSITDNQAYNVAMTGPDNLILASSGSNYKFNGIAFTPASVWTGKTSTDYSVASNWVNEYAAPASATTTQLLIPKVSSGNYPSVTASTTIGGGIVQSEANISVATGQTLTINNTLVLKSDANGTARIANSTGGAISGNISAERFIPSGKRSFRFLTAPLTTTNFIKNNWQEGVNNTSLLYASNQNPTAGFGTHITGSASGTNGFDASTTGSASMFQFNNATQTWNTGITNTDATNLVAGNAYRILIRGNRSFDLSTTSATNTATTLRATGTPFVGTATLSSGASTPATMPTLAAGIDTYSFIANPYASPINWASLGRTEITGFYYIWDPTLATRGAYVSCFTDGTKSNGSSAVTTAIQSGQAFFVQNTSNVAARQLVITEANKTTSNINGVFRTQTSASSLSTQLFLTANLSIGISQDGVNSSYNNGFSNTVDSDDANKFINLDENIAIQKGNKLLSIERRNLPTLSDTLQFKVWQLTHNNYTLRIDAANFDAGLNAFLQDNFANTEMLINLNGTTDINFTTTSNTATTATDRFRIVFRTGGTLPVTFTNIKGYQKNTSIQVEWNTANEVNIANYEVEKSADGISFSKIATVAAANTTSYTWLDAKPTNGNNYYRIKAIGKNGGVQYTQIVNVKIGGIKNTFTVVGNPVKNKVLVLQLENVEKANYTMNLYSNNGQLIFSKNMAHLGGSATETIDLGNMSTATYQLIIIGGNSTKITKTIMVD